MFRDLVDGLDSHSTEPGKLLDVPFVPTDEDVIEAMLNLGEVGPKDVLYDLGSGDGRILITAAKKRGTHGIGVEIDPLRIADAMDEAGRNRLEYLVDFIEEDIFTVDFSAATVVTLYLLESINVQLRPRLLSELHPGTRIISHAFGMGDWKADEQLELRGGNLRGISIYKWIVPAQVAGVWEWDDLNNQRYRVALRQQYQAITGSAWLADKAMNLKYAKLCGNRLELEIQDGKTAALNTFTLIFKNNELQSVLEDA
ncbi:class I SAM-dependent methyltransferase [Alcaligenaceae bacterium]|nr:class I SAM-dependent methyltransferase [Alcaligenaceae bacterium]